MSRLKLVISLLLPVLLVQGCSEVVNLKTELGPSQLLVFGRITDGLEGNIIQLSRTSTFNGEQEPVTGAVVKVVAEDGNTEHYLEVESGEYELANESLTGQPGMSYYLEIDVPGGKTYRSTPEIMPENNTVDILDFEAGPIRIPIENNAEISRNMVSLFMRSEFLDVDQDFYIRWNLIETYLFPERPKMVNSPDYPPQWCYITNDLEGQSVFLHDGRVLKNPVISRRLMTRRLADNAFVSSYYFQVVRSSLTKGAYRYWDEVNQVANAQGSIFDRPLAAVQSNIYNIDDPDEEILGYFEVSNVDTTRLLIRENDTPFSISTPCPLFGPISDECDNCLLLDNSAKVKPYFVTG
ncbi:MAG: DUF4249 domain-containing protein [Roseivirga sp.]|nr:DUF4249 domain-containing protein [Roseivirga sp.]